MSTSWKDVPVRSERVGSLRVTISEAIPVALSEPGEERWGVHQFPTLSALPDGRLLVTYNCTGDRDSEYGWPGPACVSGDGGLTWARADAGNPSLAISNSVIS